MSYAREQPTARKALLELARKGASKRAPEALRVVKDTVALVQPAGARSFRFTLSTAMIDRVSDVVSQTGWDLTAYKRCPVVLWQHDHDLPIGRGVDVRVKGGRLKGTVVLDAADVPVVGPYAEMTRQKLVAGSLFACSVGFRPLDFDIAEDRAGFEPVFIFKRQELTEWSIVAIPCNPDAVVDEADSLQAAVHSVTSAASGGTRKLTPALHRLTLLDKINSRWPG